MIPIPAYIDPEAWQGFCDMRKLIKKPMTMRAAKMLLVKLQRMKDAGQDPNAALDQSTTHCWADVYCVKEEKIEASGRMPEYRPEPPARSEIPAWFKDKHIRRVA